MGINSSYMDMISFLKLNEKDRNKEIFNEYKKDKSIERLSKEYMLSPSYIQFILHKQRLIEEYEIL